MTDFYQNDKNSQNNSSGVHSDAELDSNHNQLNCKAVIDLMVKRDEAGQQMHVSCFQSRSPFRDSCGRRRAEQKQSKLSWIFNFSIRHQQSSDSIRVQLMMNSICRITCRVITFLCLIYRRPIQRTTTVTDWICDSAAKCLRDKMPTIDILSGRNFVK